MPMNIKTKSSIAIENQLQKSLFDDMGDVFEPVVFLDIEKTVLEIYILLSLFTLMKEKLDLK